MISVLQVLDSFNPGGITSFIVPIYNHIRRQKVCIDFVLRLYDKNEMGSNIIESGASIYTCPAYYQIENSILKTHFIFTHWWNDFFIKHTDYCILHSHLKNTMALSFLIAKKYGLHTIAHSHTSSFTDPNQYGIVGLARTSYQKLIRYVADYQFACTNEAGRYLFGESVVTKPYYKVIPNGIDLERFCFISSVRAKMRKNLGVDNSFLIGHVARLMPIKNQFFLIKIFYEIHIIDRTCILLIVGDGKLRNELENEAKRLGVDEFVLFVGAKQNTEDYYNAMDVLVLPSFSEGLPLVTIEAQATGLPCVVSTAVSREADMGANLLIRKELADGEKSWAETILSLKKHRRKDESNTVRRAGFDASATAAWLEEFYLRVGNGEKVSFLNH